MKQIFNCGNIVLNHVGKLFCNGKMINNEYQVTLVLSNKELISIIIDDKNEDILTSDPNIYYIQIIDEIYDTKNVYSMKYGMVYNVTIYRKNDTIIGIGIE